LWGGLQSATANYLLQGVLTWGANGDIVKQSNVWYVTPWYLYPGHPAMVGHSLHVNPGNDIFSTLEGYNCIGGACSWTLTLADATTGHEVQMTVGNSPSSYIMLLGAVMEVPRGTGCIEAPADGRADFRGIQAVMDNTAVAAPQFGKSTPDPQCSVSVQTSSNAANILFRP
jgi:hypothetical protein